LGELGLSGFLGDQYGSCISPENGGIDVRWVRFPKHIPLFFTLSQLESVGLRDFPVLVQRAVRCLIAIDELSEIIVWMKRERII